MRWWLVVGVLAVAAGCAQPRGPITEGAPVRPVETSAPAAAVEAPREPLPTIPAPGVDGVVARNARFALVVPRPGDTAASLAERFLGGASQAWRITDFNEGRGIEPGRVLAVPLQIDNARGVHANGYQTVPILCYHRFGPRPARMTVTPENFDRQIEWLVKNDYRVVRLSDLVDFLAGKRALPRRAVVLTVDDGHVTAYQHAFPILKKHGVPATFFMYTDFMGAKEGLSNAQMREMVASGLVDFQAHSKTHANLTQRLPNESDARYRERIDVEVRAPREAIARALGTNASVTHYAFPYGDANELVLDRLREADYKLGLTVNPGGNSFYAHPLMLRRTMVFGEHDLEQFKAMLQVFRELNLR